MILKQKRILISIAMVRGIFTKKKFLFYKNNQDENIDMRLATSKFYIKIVCLFYQLNKYKYNDDSQCHEFI